MNLAKNAKLNLHIFDGAGAVGGGEVGEGGSLATSEGNQADNTQSAQGENSTNHAAGDKNSANSADEGRAKYENYIKNEGKPFFEEHVQNIINKRFKELKTYQSNEQKLQPLIDAIVEDYNITDTSDIGKIVDSYLNNEQRLIDRAASNGLTPEAQMQFDQLERENRLLKKQQETEQREKEQEQVIESWKNDEQAIKEKYNQNFDLLSELNENQEFNNLVVNFNFPVSKAYEYTHMEEINKKIAADTEKRVVDNIRSRGIRVPENAFANSPAANTKIDISKLTAKDMEAYAARAERGERISFV